MHKRAKFLRVNVCQIGCSEQSKKTHNFRKIIFVTSSPIWIPVQCVYFGLKVIVKERGLIVVFVGLCCRVGKSSFCCHRDDFEQWFSWCLLGAHLLSTNCNPRGSSDMIPPPEHTSFYTLGLWILYLHLVILHWQIHVRFHFKILRHQRVLWLLKRSHVQKTWNHLSRVGCDCIEFLWGEKDQRVWISGSWYKESSTTLLLS